MTGLTNSKFVKTIEKLFLKVTLVFFLAQLTLWERPTNRLTFLSGHTIKSSFGLVGLVNTKIYSVEKQKSPPLRNGYNF